MRQTEQPPEPELRLSARTRFTAAAFAGLLLLVGGFFLWGGLEDGIPRDRGLAIVVALGLLMAGCGCRLGYAALTGRASELLADILDIMGGLPWHHIM